MRAAAFDPSVSEREVIGLDAMGDTMAYFSEERLASLHSWDLVGFYNRAARIPLGSADGRPCLVVEEFGDPVIDDILACHDGETDVLKVDLDQFLLQQQ